MQNPADVGNGFELLIAVLAAFGVNIAGIIGGVIAFSSRLTRIEAAITAAEKLTKIELDHSNATNARAIIEIEKDLGKLEERVNRNKKDIDDVAELTRELASLKTLLQNIQGVA